MNQEILPQALRRRLTVHFKLVLANELARPDSETLSFNRLSGAVYQELLQAEYVGLSEDQLVNLAVEMTERTKLGGLLARYDARIVSQSNRASAQVLGIVKNLVPENIEHRDQVIAETLDMLKRFPLVRSIPGIRTLVQARLANGNQDVDELDYPYLH